MKKIIVITSGKGGVGKTTTAINLGAAINFFKKDVLVIDANLSTPNVGVHLNSPEVPINLNHVLMNRAEPFEAVYEHDSGMKIMPSSLSIKNLRKIKPEKIKEFRNDFRKLADHTIVDCAAGLGSEALAIMELADELIIVTNPEMPAITDALKTIKVAEEMKKPIKGIIITRVKKNNIEIGPETVKEMLEIPILGMIPEDIHISKALNLRNAVVNSYPKSKPSRAYKEIAARILDIEYDSNKDKEKLFARLLRTLKFKVN